MYKASVVDCSMRTRGPVSIDQLSRSRSELAASPSYAQVQQVHLRCSLRQHHKPRRLHTPPRAAGRRDTSQSNSGGLDPALEREVPPEQRPVNELKALRKTNLYSWATLSTPGYLKRLGITWLGFFTVIGGPIAYQTFDPSAQPIEFAMSAAIGALVVVAVAVLRIYLGWAYVGDRLLSAAVEYEETGWYDGQLFVKPPEILARDRLLGSYEVQPVLQRLKTTLTGGGAALLLSSVILTSLIQAGTDSDGMYGRGSAQPRTRTANGIIYSQALDLYSLRDDDDAAAAEALAQGGRPGYCGDSHWTAFAGGAKVCAKFDSEQKSVPRLKALIRNDQ